MKTKIYKESDIFFSKHRLNLFKLPRIVKVVLHLHAGTASVNNPDFLQETYPWFALISNQKPKIVVAKKDNSNFKIRKNTEIAMQATLRKNKALNFLQKLSIINSCRFTNFHGFKMSFDQNNNWNIGISDTLIFPEVDYQKLKYKFGIDITVVTKNLFKKEEAIIFFEKLNIKFLKEVI